MGRAAAYRFSALMLLLVGLALGGAVVSASGANTLVKQVLGLGVPTLAGLIFALAWWRQARRPGW